MSQAVFLSARLSTLHICMNQNQVSKFCKKNSNAFWVLLSLHQYITLIPIKRIQMHFEYYSICMNITLIHINLLIVRYAYVSGGFSQCQTFYLTHMYEPKTKSANFVKRIQIYFEYNSLETNTGLININLLIFNTEVSGSFSQHMTVYQAHM